MMVDMDFKDVKSVENALLEQLRKQSPDAIRDWINGKGSMVDVAIKHRLLLRTILKMNRQLREKLEALDYEIVVKNICEVYPELEKELRTEKAKARIESEIIAIKKVLL